MNQHVTAENALIINAGHPDTYLHLRELELITDDDLGYRYADVRVAYLEHIAHCSRCSKTMKLVMNQDARAKTQCSVSPGLD